MTWLTNPYRFGGGISAMTAQYWMFIPLAWPYTTGGLITGEIGLAGTPGGSSLLTGGTATASHGTAANAFDGNTTTRWQLNVSDITSPGAGWLKYATAAPISPVEFFGTAGGFTGDEPGMPSVWLIRSSQDAVTYTSVMIAALGQFTSVSQKKTAALAPADFTDIEANARCWEFQMTGHPGSGMWMREIEFRPTYGGSALSGLSPGAYTTKPYAGSGSDGKAERLFDGNTATLNVTSAASWLTNNRLGFVSDAEVGAMEEMRVNPESGDYMTACTVRWSVDGLTYPDKKSFSSITGWSNGTFKSFDLR